MLGNGVVVFVAEWDVVLVGGSNDLGGAMMVAGRVGGVIIVFVGWGVRVGLQGDMLSH